MRRRGSDETSHCWLLAGDSCILLLFLESAGLAKTENRAGKRNIGSGVSQSQTNIVRHLSRSCVRRFLLGRVVRP